MNSLQDIANELNNDKNSIVLGNFLDDVRYEFKNGKLKNDYFKDEPIWPENLKEKHISFFVSILHSLCNEFEFKIPKWILDNKFVLKDPYFAMDAKGMLRVILIQESPKEFRGRNIFTTSNVLRRA